MREKLRTIGVSIVDFYTFSYTLSGCVDEFDELRRYFLGADCKPSLN